MNKQYYVNEQGFGVSLLVHALVHSRLDYCNSVLVRLPWSLVQQLQSVLNSAARLIFGLKRFDRITPALMDLHWLPYIPAAHHIQTVYDHV